MTPQITLLIPCYNAAKFLPRLHAAVCALTRPFDRVLCYDDGSTDDTVALAGSLGLEIITGQPNRGVAVARNRLAAAATTTWIHFHDADDSLAPTFVERMAAHCDDDHDVVSCDADWVDDDDRRSLQIAWRYDPAQLASRPLPHLLEHAMGLNNSIVRRSIWQRIGGCDETLTMWEDADVHIRLAWEGARFFHLPEVLTHSLRRGESFSHDYRKSWTCRVAALEHYADRPHPPDLAAVLAAQAEIAAASLALHGERSATERAIRLCQRLGVRPPTTRQFLLRILKPAVPAYHLLRWQARLRNRPAS